MQHINKRQLLFTMAFCTFVLQSIAKEDVAKEHVSRLSVPALTKVNVYNPAPVGTLGHVLPVTLSEVKSSGKPLDQSKYWPGVGDTVVAYGPTNYNKSGITQIAEFSRWTGLSSGTDYEFTQVVDLPEVGPVLFLKQRMNATLTNTRAWIGVSSPKFNLAENFFSDNQWHQTNIPHINQDGEVLGDYVVTFCLYHWNSLSYQIGRMSAYNTNLYESPCGSLAHAFSSVGSIVFGCGVADIIAMERVDKLLADNEQKFKENMIKANELIRQTKAQYERTPEDIGAITAYKGAIIKQEQMLQGARAITQAAQNELQSISNKQTREFTKSQLEQKKADLAKIHKVQDKFATENINALAEEKSVISKRQRDIEEKRAKDLYRKPDTQAKLQQAQQQEEQPGKAVEVGAVEVRSVDQYGGSIVESSRTGVALSELNRQHQLEEQRRNLEAKTGGLTLEEKNIQYQEERNRRLLEEQAREQNEQRLRAQQAEKDFNKKVQISVAVVSVVVISTVAAAVLTMGMPTPYANAVYKIEYKKR